MGLAIRKSGSAYEYALLVLLADLTVQRCVDALKAKAAVPSADITSALVAAMSPTYTSDCGYTATTDAAATDATLDTLILETRRSAAAFEDILSIIDEYGLKFAWDLAPVLNGNYIKQVRITA